ncbi:MAG: serine hydrolase, partial [Oscillospiraceae bacterium]
SVAKYIPEFTNTEMEKITIKDCLQMSSGIDFDEAVDMSKISMTSMFGKSKMKSIVQYGLLHEPGTNRTYSSINTDILGEVVANATGYTLSEYMREKLWSKIGVEQDAYWTLSNGKELANGGLHISLRDYARFAGLYMNGGVFEGEQIIPSKWIKDSMATNEPHLKAPLDGKPYDEFGYGYQWWIPEGNEHEFMAIGVFGQWIYINPVKEVIIVKTSADSGFEDDNKKRKQ